MNLPSDTPGYFLDNIIFKKDCRCFKEGDKIPFLPGANILVGDQGSGKSTIIRLVRDSNKKLSDHCYDLIDVAEIVVSRKGPMYSIDLESDLTRNKVKFLDNVDMVFQVMQMKWSHGQTVLTIARSLQSMRDSLILLDEPDMALSPRSAYELAERLKVPADQGCQIIASIHNPIVIQAFPEVYSLEHRKHMTSEEFLETQKIPLPKKQLH